VKAWDKLKGVERLLGSRSSTIKLAHSIISLTKSLACGSFEIMEYY
jgi:hypothetical protein